MNERMEQMDLKMNVGETKVVVFDRDGEQADCNVEIRSEAVEQVDEFVYLGRMFQNDGRLDGEMERRTNAGRKVTGSLWRVVKNENLSMGVQMAVYRSVFLPTLLYGSESWVCLQKHKGRLNAAGMDFLRRACGKTRMDRVRNEWVRDECGVKLSVSDLHDRRVMRWFGHVERMSEERLTKQIYEAKVQGTSGRGRQRKSWLNVVDEILKEGNVRSLKNRRACQKRCMNVNEAKAVCRDRLAWRKIVKSLHE